jgi:hypothetical protein
MTSANLPALLQSFFTDRLLRQRQASAHTIAGYRDCFRLLLHFAKDRLGKMPSQFRVATNGGPSSSSIGKRLTRCSPRRIFLPGWAAVIAPSFCLLSRRVCGSLSW